MRLIDQQGTLALLCDACGAPFHGEGTVGLQRDRIVAVHGHCRDRFSQFFLNDKDREIPLAAFVAELAAL
jgi:hypothetical protein